jgi:hypothetical protein
MAKQRSRKAPTAGPKAPSGDVSVVAPGPQAATGNEAEVAADIVRIRAEAEADASRLIRYLDEIGCRKRELRETLSWARRTLGSLFQASTAPDGPYSLELIRLALRFALNPSIAVTGDLGRFKYQRDDGGWTIHEFASRRMAMLPAIGPGRRIESPISVSVLDCVLNSPRHLDDLRLLVLKVLGHEPTALDVLPQQKGLRFAYRIDERGDQYRVQLWIEDVEVSLPNRRDIHALLRIICTDRKHRIDIGQAKNEGIVNPPRARQDIQKALSRVLPEAASWLESKPIGWANGYAPKARRGEIEESRPRLSYTKIHALPIPK